MRALRMLLGFVIGAVGCFVAITLCKGAIDLELPWGWWLSTESDGPAFCRFVSVFCGLGVAAAVIVAEE